MKKIKRLKHAVTRSYSRFASNAYIYINDANFHYAECEIAELFKESSIIKRYMCINIRMNK